MRPFIARSAFILGGLLPALAFAQDLTVCVGKGYTLTSAAPAAGTSEVTYEWYENGENMGSAYNTKSISITEGRPEGTYYYARKASNAECTAGVFSNTFTVAVAAAPAAPTNLASNVTTICNGTATSATLTASGGSVGSGAVYEWGTGATVGSNLVTTTTGNTYSVSPSAATTYWVRLKGTAACSVTATGGATTSVGVYAAITAGAITTGSTTTYAETNPNVTITSETAALGGSDNITYEWRRTGTSSATLAGSDATYAISNDVSNYSTAGTYYINRYAKDATCSNSAWVQSSNTYTLGVISSSGTFNSNTTWSYGGLTWSDRVVASPSNCTKVTSLTTSNNTTAEYKVDYSTGVDRYYYSWTCATGGTSGGTNAQLCPSGWRLTTQSDAAELVNATTYSNLIAIWGYGGYADGRDMLLVNSGTYLWTSTQSSSAPTSSAYNLRYYPNMLGASHTFFKYLGLEIRCVK